MSYEIKPDDALIVRAAARVSEWITDRYAEHCVRQIIRTAKKRKKQEAAKLEQEAGK